MSVGISEITHDAVLAALAEHDGLGPAEFASRYGYGRARAYLLRHEGQEYDAKAIADVAHRHVRRHRVLPAAELDELLVVKKLKDLGFKVVKHQSPDWLEAELILACDLAARNGWRTVRAHKPPAIDLSRLLRSLPLYPDENRTPDFRSPSSVQRKTEDISTKRPDYTGKRTRGGTLEWRVLEAFLERPDEMHAAADAIRNGMVRGEFEDLPISPDPDEEEAIREGRLLLRRHLVRERNPVLRRMKIEQTLAQQGTLACEVCSFDFERIYGERGAGFAECHHKTPLHVTGPVDNRVENLAVLCANCHRMIHRGSQ